MTARFGRASAAVIAAAGAALAIAPVPAHATPCDGERGGIMRDSGFAPIPRVVASGAAEVLRQQRVSRRTRAARLRDLRSRAASVSGVSAPSYARTSFLYAIRCGWSASAPFRRFRSSMYDW